MSTNPISPRSNSRFAMTGYLASAGPTKLDVLGVSISPVTYNQAVDAIVAAAGERRSMLVTALAVHGTVEAVRDPVFGRALRDFELVCPDGQPVRWAMNILYGANLADRVYGPELMLRVCRQAASEGLGVYLYGSTETTVTRLKQRLCRRFPGLRIVGSEPSVFRPLSLRDELALAERIRASGAAIVFVGLGCPRQERFAAENRSSIRAVQVCVGAAFDFHAGIKPQAPRWMQDRGLEWAFRLGCEPRRLWRRYALTNSFFLWRLARQLLATGRRPTTNL